MPAVRLLTVLLALAAPLACGGGDETADAGGAGGSVSCPPGQVAHPSGEGCMPVGIQGCADMFLGDDGLCAPSPDHCPAGTIPKFDEGCVAVGIAGCAPEFLEDDGQCYPLPEKCPAGTFPVPTEGCIPIDGPQGCGTGTWGNIAPAPGTVWVDPAYVGGGSDGSQQAPFTTIAAALAVASAGGRVALAAGDYAEPVTIDKPLELVGRCPSMVTIRGTQTTPFSPLPVIVHVKLTMGALVRGVRLSGPGIGVVADGGAVELAELHIDQAASLGVLSATGGTLTVRRALIERTLPGSFGYGLCAMQGSEVVLQQSALLENHSIGLAALEGGTSVAATGCLVARTRPPPNGSYPGLGAVALLGASLSFDASAVVENHGFGAGASDVGSMLAMRASLVARTQPDVRGSADTAGYGLQALNGASASLDGSALVANHSIGLAVGDAETTVVVLGSLLARTEPQASDLHFGMGASAKSGASLSLEESAIVENRAVALSGDHAETTVSARRCLLARTAPDAGNLFGGYGADAGEGAKLTLDESAIVENRAVALGALGAGTTIAANGCFVARTLPNAATGAEGMGVAVTTGAALELHGSLLRENRVMAVLATQPSTTATVAGSLFDGIATGSFHTYKKNVPVATYDGVGDGLVVGFGASAAVTDTRVRGAARAGVLFQDSSGLVRGVDVSAERFGIVLQGALGPDWQDGSNHFAGGEQNVLLDGNLPVPEAPPVPEG